MHVLNDLEIGFEQQFIMPDQEDTHKKSFGYFRYIPFRNWVVAPFIGARAGWMFLPETDAAVFGAGFGATFFASEHIAFEGRVYYQMVTYTAGMVERQVEFDWRVVLYF